MTRAELLDAIISQPDLLDRLMCLATRGARWSQRVSRGTRPRPSVKPRRAPARRFR